MLVISDLHSPWMHPRALDHLKRTYDLYKCNKVVCLGDEIDAAAFAIKWPVNPDLPSASDELKWAIEKLQPFYETFPDVDVCSSNHGQRIFRKARVSGLPSAVIRRYQEILEYPEGWHYADEFEIDGVIYAHGDSFNRTSWRDGHKSLKQSFAIGHIHSSPGVLYSQSRSKRYFAAQFGCLIDPRQAAFDYGKHCLEKPAIGCGVVIDGEAAFFVPMPIKQL